MARRRLLVGTAGTARGSGTTDREMGVLRGVRRLVQYAHPLANTTRTSWSSDPSPQPDTPLIRDPVGDDAVSHPSSAKASPERTAWLA